MKNFIYPIAMRCNQEQFESIKPELEKMGYEISPVFIDGDWGVYPYLVSHFACKNNSICYSNKEGNILHNRHVFDTWNPDLFLALAAITDSDKPEYGEYWEVVNDIEPEQFIRHDGKVLINNVYSFFNSHYYQPINCLRKHTPEQIINHFTNNKKQEIMENKEFTKADLKTGMRVGLCDGTIGMVLENVIGVDNGLIMIGLAGYSLYELLSNYSDDLRNPRLESHTIEKVWNRPAVRELLTKNLGELLWERNDTVEMTVEEISKALGKKVKVVASK